MTLQVEEYPKMTKNIFLNTNTFFNQALISLTHVFNQTYNDGDEDD